MSSLSLHSLLAALQVPPEIARHDTVTEGGVVTHLEEWQINAYQSLSNLKEVLLEQNESLALQDEADLVSTVAALDGNEPWISPNIQSLSRVILTPFIDPKLHLLQHILIHKVKYLFQSNPHPSFNLSTGRTLSRPAGGPMASQDCYEGQTWKLHPGVPNLLLWCVRHIQSTQYEDLWHLIIPPVMTLVDDYQAPYKLKGIEIVSEMLKRVPTDLLRRTGVDALLLSSLRTSLHHLQNPETPALIRIAIPTTLSLIQLTTAPGSAPRFEQLCTLLGDGIIGGIWVYSSSDPDVILASIDVLPLLVTALGIGSARYLKALVPQLVHALLPNDVKPVPANLQLSSLIALDTVIEECSPRMHKWKGTILEGVGKCWVTAVNSQADMYTVELKGCLVVTCAKLAKACPSVQEDYHRLLLMDCPLFEALVGRG